MFGFDDEMAERRFWLSLYLSAIEDPEDEVVDAVLQASPMEELLDALQADDPRIRGRATEMFWRVSMAEAGDLALEELLLGVRLSEKGSWDEAIECLSEIVTNYPEFAEAYHRRAVALCGKGDYAAAIGDCRDALALRPSHFGVWHRLGLCYVALDAYEQAADALRAALRIQPYAEDTAQLLAYCRGKLAAKSNGPTSPENP